MNVDESIWSKWKKNRDEDLMEKILICSQWEIESSETEKAMWDTCFSPEQETELAAWIHELCSCGLKVSVCDCA